MMYIWRIAQSLLQLVFIVSAIEFGDDIRFNLKLNKHQPCRYESGVSTWNRSLEFESGDGKRGPQLKAITAKPGCYSIGGRVNVSREFKGDFSVYIEMRNSANKKEIPEPCINRKPNGCGGFGSCLYCDACKTLGSSIGVQSHLLVDGRRLECGKGLSPGIYENIDLVFCLPPIEEILKSQGLTKESFLSLLRSEDGHSLRTMGIFVTVYIFDTDVSKLMQTQAKVETIYRKGQNTFFKNEPLPTDVYYSLQFNSMIHNQRVFVACHKIHGNVEIIA